MPRPKIAFVIGAGASAEVGLPTGLGLIDRIKNDLNVQIDFIGRPISGSAEIAAAIRQLFLQNPGSIGTFDSWTNSCLRLRDGLSQFPQSIDTYLDSHSADTKMVTSGKLAIANAILAAERSSSLHFNPSNNRVTLDFKRFQQSWYPCLQRLLFSGIKPESIDAVFDSTSFVIFNYDRCLEHFLYHALMGYFHLDDATTKSHLKKLRVFHPYGTVAPLSWQNHQDGVDFGAPGQPQSLLKSIDRIKLFTEQEQNELEISAIRSTLAVADVVIFLGFSYQQQNMRLLSVQESNRHQSIFGTAFGISDLDIPIVQRNTLKALGERSSHKRVILKSNWTCRQLLDDLHHTLHSIEPTARNI